MCSSPAPEPTRSSAEHILEAAGFKPTPFGYASDDFPGIEIPEDDARRMNSRDLLLRIYREATARGRSLLQGEVRGALGAFLGIRL